MQVISLIGDYHLLKANVFQTNNSLNKLCLFDGFQYLNRVKVITWDPCRFPATAPIAMLLAPVWILNCKHDHTRENAYFVPIFISNTNFVMN